MARCIYCYNILTAKDDYCYHCGDRVAKFADVKPRAVSGWTNLVFLGSLAFTAYCFFVAHLLSLPVTIAVSCTLLLLRFAAEYLVHWKSKQD
ncbi:MAG TPA: hypothetical protein VFW44_07905 [Bryobacteraceae bacterium]|nr:hypothetical protein [Bryobacteraceae bacterium]